MFKTGIKLAVLFFAGKEQWKKNKKDMKEAKKHSDAKKATKGWQVKSGFKKGNMQIFLYNNSACQKQRNALVPNLSSFCN